MSETLANKKKKERLANRKKMIDILKDRPLTYGDLVKEMQKKTKIAETTVDRIRRDLKDLGLILKIGRYWTWYIQTRKYTPQMHAFLTNHAKKLLPGLQHLLTYGVFREEAQPHYRYGDTPEPSISHQKLSVLSKCVESHLKARYPHIYENLITYRTLSDNYEESEGKEKKLIDVLRGRFHLTNNGRPCWRWEYAWPKKDLVTHGVPYVLGPLDNYEVKQLTHTQQGPRWKRNIPPLITSHSGIKELKRIKLWFIKGPIQGKEFDGKEVEELLKTWRSMEEVYGDLAKQIYELKLQVEHGWPLDGTCGLCRNILIENENPAL